MSSPILLALWLASGCLEVTGARITAFDLKTVLPGFSAVTDAAEFGYAPAPGATRWVRRAELVAFAARHGAATEQPVELCVTRRAQALTAELAESAIRRSLARLAPGDEAQVDIIDYVRLPLPKGEIVFSPRDIHASTQGAVLWRGKVEYDRNRSVPVWVKAKILVGRPVLYARTAIAKGRSLTADDGERRVAQVPLDEALKFRETPAIAGMEALCDIAAGQMITADLLGRPLAVRKGDAIRAVSETGGVRLTIEALALQSGRTGDVIPVENKSNKRQLRATIAAPGQVQILHEGNENENHRRAGPSPGARPAGGQRQGSAEADPARSAHREPVAGALRPDVVSRQPI